MRNDTHDDLDLVPGLRATDDADDLATVAEAAYTPKAPAQSSKSGAATGLLWCLVLVLSVALGGTIIWGRGQLQQINAQLIATQDSFAQISEAAAGQIQDISGKVVATESSQTSERESMKLRIKQLETQQAESQRQWQAVSAAANALKTQQGQLETALTAQKTALSLAEAGFKKAEQAQAGLQAELAAVKRSQPQVEPLTAELARLKQDLVELKKVDHSAALRRLEQDLFVLRSGLESQPSGQNNAEFDAFRGQMTRNINALQSQVQNLQQQLDALR